MKNTIILILQIIILGIVSSCEKNEEGITFVDFSDNVFYEWCLSSFDLDGDQELSFRELYLVTEMNIPAQYNGQIREINTEEVDREKIAKILSEGE